MAMNWTTEYDGSLVMGGEVVTQPIGPDGSTRKQRVANTRLMAAAPDLLAAAKAIAAYHTPELSGTPAFAQLMDAIGKAEK